MAEEFLKRDCAVIINGRSQQSVDNAVEDYTRIVNISLPGMMHGSHIAVNGMMKQGHGQLFNMEGFGSGGRERSGFTSYGLTKYALRYFTQSLQKELEDKPVLVGTLSPGWSSPIC